MSTPWTAHSSNLKPKGWAYASPWMHESNVLMYCIRNQLIMACSRGRLFRESGSSPGLY